ncbi:tetratricopeptide repeat protein [Streptomyces sp. PTD9-10]|uniref:tetratricopeptide repeat protein n=1 Tax=Streptomyces sp. PTD9-10 TaxID=3120151 RepID=UPI003FCC7715
MGREDELRRLLPLLAPAPEGAGTPILISALAGMGGIGKTALAIEAAHRACAQGWFPGGTLFVDLRGYDDNPVTADQAVLALLDALGVQGADLPTTSARQYDVYGDRLTGRARTLLVLDNASDPEQFRELLPGADHHRVLITSRDRQDTLPIRHVDLETLDPADSVALLTHALHNADERDDRPEREPSALYELASLCGHLPMALQIAAAMLRRRRLRDIASLVTEIRTAGDPTRVLDNGSPGTDLYGRSLALRPVLETSYRRLPSEQARLLRLLALAPGEDARTETAAALADLTEDAALRLLEDLAATYLVTPVRGTSTIRWRLHDLVRSFGAGVADGNARLREEAEAARERLLSFYWRWADAADDRLHWLPGRKEPEGFADRAQALTWLDEERAGLVGAVQWAREKRYAALAGRLAACLTEYLDWRRYFDDWLTVAEAALEAAGHTGNRAAEAGAWLSLGNALLETERTQETIAAFTRARDLYQAEGEQRGEAGAWGGLGLALQNTDAAEQAIDAHTHARELLRAIGERRDEAMETNNLGLALRFAGRPYEAVEAHARARDLFQAEEDRYLEATAWNNLGLALEATDQMAEAIAAFEVSLRIKREFGHWYEIGKTANNLAIAYKSAGLLAQARTHYLEAADAYAQADAPAEATNAQSAADALT